MNRPPRWTELAVCAEVDPDLFFPDEYGPAGDAIAICRSCEVRPQCLRYAFDHPGESGVWGGFSERRRQDQVRLYRAGVPAEDIIAADDEVFYARLDLSAELAEAALERSRQRRRDKAAALRASADAAVRRAA